MLGGKSTVCYLLVLVFAFQVSLEQLAMQYEADVFKHSGARFVTDSYLPFHWSILLELCLVVRWLCSTCILSERLSFGHCSYSVDPNVV